MASPSTSRPLPTWFSPLFIPRAAFLACPRSAATLAPYLLLPFAAAYTRAPLGSAPLLRVAAASCLAAATIHVSLVLLLRRKQRAIPEQLSNRRDLARVYSAVVRLAALLVCLHATGAIAVYLLAVARGAGGAPLPILAALVPLSFAQAFGVSTGSSWLLLAVAVIHVVGAAALRAAAPSGGLAGGKDAAPLLLHGALLLAVVLMGVLRWRWDKIDRLEFLWAERARRREVELTSQVRVGRF